LAAALPGMSSYEKPAATAAHRALFIGGGSGV